MEITLLLEFAHRDQLRNWLLEHGEEAKECFFDTSKPNISMHISNILKEGELQSESVVKNYLTTNRCQTTGKI